MAAVIDSFRGRYEFLSNFAWVGDTTVEHQWQAEKTLDLIEREKILRAPTPREAKKLGRWEVKLRPEWEDIKYDRMKFWLQWKFTQVPFADLLEATGEAVLIEGNRHGDDIWGCVWRNGGWSGKNHLGRLLTEVRSEARHSRISQQAVAD